jgi:hypothetical protein
MIISTALAHDFISFAVCLAGGNAGDRRGVERRSARGETGLGAAIVGPRELDC